MCKNKQCLVTSLSAAISSTEEVTRQVRPSPPRLAVPWTVFVLSRNKSFLRSEEGRSIKVKTAGKNNNYFYYSAALRLARFCKVFSSLIISHANWRDVAAKMAGAQMRYYLPLLSFILLGLKTVRNDGNSYLTSFYFPRWVSFH